MKYSVLVLGFAQNSSVLMFETVELYAKPNTSTEYFIDLNATDYVQSSSGTISVGGFNSSYTTYINGIPSSTIDTNQWNHIAITTDTALSGSAITIGQVSTNYLQGFIDDVKIYDYARSAGQIKADYNSRGAVKGTSARFGARNEWMSDGLVGYWKMDF